MSIQEKEKKVQEITGKIQEENKELSNFIVANINSNDCLTSMIGYFKQYYINLKQEKIQNLEDQLERILA